MIRVLLALLSMGCGVSATAPMRADRARVLTGNGREVSLEELGESLDGARAIYVGERHDHAADHRAELALLSIAHARDPSLALGMEMVQFPFQEALDAYASGAIDEATMLTRIDWRERWGFDYAFYRPMVRFAREHGMPIVALNARAELTRSVAQRGIAELTESERAELPELDLSHAEHRALVEEALRGHPGLDEAALERFYAAQVVWDETMAERIALAMGRTNAPHRIFVIAGTMHVQSGLGIPRCAARRGISPFVVVMPVDENDVDEAVREDPPIADFLWVVR